MEKELSMYMDPSYYTNRELSWIKFNERVLSEARDKNLPLFERLKFLSITESNLDEFFMIRVASLKDMVHAGYTKKDLAGLTASEQLELILKQAHELVNVSSIRPSATFPGSGAATARGWRLSGEPRGSDGRSRAAFVDRYFEENVYPVLTPMAVDSSRPFPLVRNKSLNIGALVA